MRKAIKPMTTPITSKYQTDPWEPTIYLTGNKDANQDQQKAAAQYTSIYGGSPNVVNGSQPSGPTPQWAPVGDLSTAFTQAPDLVPTPPSNSTSGTSGSAALGDTKPFYIDLGAARSAEQQCLNATSAAVSGFEALKATVGSAIDSGTIYGQDVENTEAINYGEGGKMPQNIQTTYDQLDQEGQAYAASADPAQSQLLAGCMAVIELMGQFNAALNNSFQMYTYTDANCAFPPTS
jgi:hypothetical protein